MFPQHPHIELDYSFTIRHAELEDIDIFHQLVKVLYSEFYGASISKEELLMEWQSPEFNIAHDSRLVFAPNGELIGFSLLFEDKEIPVRPYIWSYVHPEWRRLGVGTALLEWAQERAKENIAFIPEDAKLTLSTNVYSANQSAKELLESLGFTTNRTRVNMLIEMNEMPPAPVFPDGIRIITYPEFGNLREVYRVLREAFRDHRGFVENDFEKDFANYQYFVTNDHRTHYDTWYLAMDGDAIIGMCLCSLASWDDPNKGWIEELGVLRDYRKRGIATALLQYSFGELYTRGIKKVGLNADGSNLTGAVKLYQNAGMRIFREWHAYEKELRAGKEYTNQG